MHRKRSWLYHPLSRLVQHLVFWVLSAIVFIRLFTMDAEVSRIDYLYAALYHITLLPAVYINLFLLLPRLANYRLWPWYLLLVAAVIAAFSYLNYGFFQNWSVYLLPDYFFISYFSWWEVCLFFTSYMAVTSLLKLSKSWFTVTELQRRLLETEKEKVQIELQALKAQVNPHFFFNTLNGIYALSLENDERLPGTVLQLSHLMRYFLYESKEELVPLDKEWQVLQDYMALQKIRSNDQLYIDKQVEGEITDQRIAPLLLITFLENAFKHGAKGNTGPVNIRLLLKVQPHDITFTVTNTRGLAADLEEGNYKGVGLNNVQRRLALLYAGRHRLDIADTTGHFTVTLYLQV